MRDFMSDGVSESSVRSSARWYEKSLVQSRSYQILGRFIRRIIAPIGRRGFIEGYFILSLIALSLFALFLYHHADIAESPQKLLRGITNLILERNFYLAIVMLFFLSFGILYLLRIRDSRLSSTLKGLFFLPLLLFYLSAAELILG